MRLIFDSDRFIPIIKHLKKQEINEGGNKLDFKPSSKETIFIRKRDEGDYEKQIHLTSHPTQVYGNIKGFTIGKKKPGVIFISSKTHLQRFDMVNKLLMDQTIKLDNIIFLGSHILKEGEQNFIKENGVSFFSMKEMSHEGCFEISESIMSRAKKFSELYVFIDSAVLEYPTIRTSWAGGMTTRELIFFIQRFKKMHNFDTAELLISPSDARVAVKLLTELYV